MQAMNSPRAAGPGHHFPPPTRRTWCSSRSQRLLPGASSRPRGGCTSPCPFVLAGTGFPSSRSRLVWGVDVHFNFLRAQGQSWGSCLFASMARCSSFCRDLHGDSHGWLLAQLGCLGTLQGTGQGMVPDLPVLVALARRSRMPGVTAGTAGWLPRLSSLLLSPPVPSPACRCC